MEIGENLPLSPRTNLMSIVAIPIQETPLVAHAPISEVGDAAYKEAINDDDIPISLYESRFHKPYAAEFFGIKPNILTALDDKGFEKLRGIDEFVKEQIQRSDLKDSKKSYNSIMNKMIELMGLSENTKHETIVDKLTQIIALRNYLK